jgi:hypothetical protein
MFEDFSRFWEKYGFEFLVCLSILIIIINYYSRRGKTGTWNSSYTYNQNLKRRPSNHGSPVRSSDSKGEIECRRVLQNIFNVSFNKARPDILRNSVTSDQGSGFNLELDCYNEMLKLACEYNGAQHYKYIPYFHKTKDSFHNQKYRDYMKRDLCNKNGITLIEVPYTVKIEHIENYIIDKLLKSGYRI